MEDSLCGGEILRTYKNDGYAQSFFFSSRKKVSLAVWWCCEIFILVLCLGNHILLKKKVLLTPKILWKEVIKLESLEYCRFYLCHSCIHLVRLLVEMAFFKEKSF